MVLDGKNETLLEFAKVRAPCGTEHEAMRKRLDEKGLSDLGCDV